MFPRPVLYVDVEFPAYLIEQFRQAIVVAIGRRRLHHATVRVIHAEQLFLAPALSILG